MRRLLTVFFLFLSFQTYAQLWIVHADSLRLGNPTGAGSLSIFGKTFLKNLTEGTAMDSVLVRGTNGQIKFVKRSSFGDNGAAGNPAGSNGQIQFNNGGAFGASAGLNWNIIDNRLGIGTSSPASLIQGVEGVADFRFSTGHLGATPTMSVINTDLGGKAASLTAGTWGAVFSYDNSGKFAILSENKSAFINNDIGTGEVRMEIDQSGNTLFKNNLSADGSITSMGNGYFGNGGVSLGASASLLSGNVLISNSGSLRVAGGDSNNSITSEESGTGNTVTFRAGGGATPSTGQFYSSPGISKYVFDKPVEFPGSGVLNSAGGLNTQIQFNDNGVIGGGDGLTWNNTAKAMYVGGELFTGGGIQALNTISTANGSFNVGATSIGSQQAYFGSTIIAPFGTHYLSSFKLEQSGDGGGSRIAWNEPYGTNAGHSVGLIYAPNITGTEKLYIGNGIDYTGMKAVLVEGDVPAGGGVAGSNAQLQFNNNGILDGTTNLSWDNTSSVLNLNGGKLYAPYNTSNSTAQLGSLEIQGYAINNGWFGDNAYFNGTAWKRRNAGFANVMYFTPSGSISFFGDGTDAGETDLTLKNVMKLKPATGEAGIGGNLQTDSNFSGSTIYLSADQNVGINTLAPTEKLEVNGNAKVNGSVSSYSINSNQISSSQLSSNQVSVGIGGLSIHADVTSHNPYGSDTFIQGGDVIAYGLYTSVGRFNQNYGDGSIWDFGSYGGLGASFEWNYNGYRVLSILASGGLSFPVTPATSESNYSILTRDNSTGEMKQISETVMILSSSTTIPSPTSTGKKGEVRIIAGYRYECMATNTWVRTALDASW